MKVDVGPMPRRRRKKGGHGRRPEQAGGIDKSKSSLVTSYIFDRMQELLGLTDQPPP